MISRSLLQAHPWHGVQTFDSPPDVIQAFIELVPIDTVKYEIDKPSGHLRLDRPQKFSNQCPAPYGFIPQTFCDEQVAELARPRTQRLIQRADHDPLDVCVLTEHSINHGGILLRARVIGGLCLIDGDEADDKIVAVLIDDPVYGTMRELDQVPVAVVDRLRHYFLTYKESPDTIGKTPRCEIAGTYGRTVALEVVARACHDYQQRFGLAPT